MSLAIEIYKSGTWYDISDYITKSGLVPYIGRNRDWSLKTETVSSTISVTCPYTLLRDDPIRYSYGGTIFFAGFIQDAKYSYSSRETDITIANDLAKLSGYLVQYDDLHTPLAAGSGIWQYIASDAYLVPEVYLMWLLQKMFTVAGLTLDTSGVEGTTAFTATWSDASTKDILYKDLYVDEGQLYCINQQVGISHTILDSDTQNYKENKISFLDLFQEICALFGFNVYITGLSTYALGFSTSNYSPSDDTKWDYKSTPYKAPNASINILKYYVQDTNDFKGSTPVYISSAGIAVGDLYGSGKSDTLFYYDNLVFKYNNMTSPSSGYEYYELYARSRTGATVPALYGTQLNLTLNKVNAMITDYTEEEITTAIDLTPRSVIQNYIDIENQESVIIQESY